MDQKTLFGGWLQQRRTALDCTQEELAQRVGCTLEMIQKIEIDMLRPSPHMAERIAACLPISREERAAFLSTPRTRSDALLSPLSISPSDGPITFLFTDIAGSTQRWEQTPEIMRAELIRHNALVRMAIEAHYGAVFKTVGDAIYAAFSNAHAALSAAIDAQRMLQSEDWGISGPLRVRMALHTGIVEMHDNDYVGLVLNQAARLLAAGHGGQILLSRATTELLRDHLPPHVELRDLGVYRLKDLIHPEQIAQVVAPNLPDDFPPLRNVVAPPGNVPAPGNALLGREHEVIAVRALLQHDAVRLVNLTGPGGTGKTRLALHVAREMRHVFADGAWFVNVAPIHDPALVLPTIAQTLGIKENGSMSLAADLRAAVSEKHMLLLLDNFEQVVDAATAIAELLAAAPKLKLLTTSRVMLHISGEHVFQVPPLALPERQAMTNPAQVARSAAVQLFVERAQALRSDFALSHAHAPAVAAICQRLDGLPLAIELAAARVRLFSPAELLARLHHSLDMLTGGARDLPTRQRTLRSTIDWSYNLLSASEQTLFRRLSVFMGGCTLEAIMVTLSSHESFERFCPAEAEILDGLTRLLDHNLLRRSERPDGEPRFFMLETLREYALEQLEQSGEVAQLRQRHAACFLALAEAAEKERGGWLDRLDVEQDNLRAALAWLLEQQDVENALRLARALGWFWYGRGYWSEGRDWYRQVLAHARGTDHIQTLATALHNMAFFVINQNDYGAGQVLLEEGLELCRELGDRAGSAWALHHLGILSREQGNAAQAVKRFEEMLAIFQELKDSEGMAWALCSLGAVAVLRQDTARATELLTKSIMLFEALGNQSGIAWALNHCGHVAQIQEDLQRAKLLHAQSLALFGADTQLGTAWARQSLGEIALAQHDTAGALIQFAESLKLFQELGNKIGVAWCLAGIAGVASATGQPQRAARLWGAAQAINRTVGGRPAPGTRASYDQTAARAQLDAESFAAAWTEGQAMTQEAAIACALELGTGEPDTTS
jgi:predicted ATPase/class 3 adenylate cyclase